MYYLNVGLICDNLKCSCPYHVHIPIAAFSCNKSSLFTGGNAIKRDCQKRIQDKGELDDGGVYLGEAGSLKCKAIAHASGPQWNGGSKNEPATLKRAISRCLHKTEKARFTSIAIPALCAGIYNYPMDLSCKHIIEELEGYLKVKNIYTVELLFFNTYGK